MMKKFIAFLLVCLPMMVGARTIWTGSKTVDWNNSSYLTVNAATMGSVSAGDCVVVTYTANASAQLQLVGQTASWNNLESRSVGETAVSTTTRFYLTSGYVAKMTSGLHISGVNATVTQIDIEDGDGSDYSNSVWIGETAIALDWSNWQTVAASAFSDAEEDYYIRFKFKDLQPGAQFGLQYNNGSSWETMPGVSNVSINTLSKQYTISAEVLTALKTYGCIVRGGGYTLTGVDIIDPSTLKTLTLGLTAADNSQFVWNGKPTIQMTVQNDNGETVTANCVLRIYKDNYTAYKTVKKSVEVAASTTETVSLDFTAEPGFYRIYATVNDEMVRDAFVVGVQPTMITSAPDKQNDFDTFWTAAKTQLNGVAINATLTELNGENGTASKSTSARKVYLVEMQSIPDGLSGEPVTIRGYYAEPTDGEKHPVIMHYLGYDSAYRPGGEGTTPYCPSGDANPDYAEFYLSTRGQSVNNRASGEREADGKGDFTNTYGDWFAFNFGNKDTYYYRGAYMDCVRAIQFMASRETSDMDNLFAEGQSQGGVFTIAAAALSGYTFKAIAPAIPFMGDFPDYFQVGSWPASVALENQGTMTDEEMYAFLSYFDTKNLATSISCPYITSIGVQDNVCPPHTNIAPYNNVTSTQKKVVYNAELVHQVNAQWSNTYNSFFFQAQENDFLADNEEYVNTEEITTEGWEQSYKFSTDIINTLKVGDKITYTVTETAYDGTNNKWPQLHMYSKSDTDERKNQYNIVQLKQGNLYSGGASIAVPANFEYTIDATDLAVIKEYNLLYLSGTANVKFTKVKVTHYVAPNNDTEDIDVTTTLYEGNTALTNWSRNYEQPTSIISQLKTGDKLTVTVGAITDGSTNSQLRIAWGSGEGNYVSWTGVHNASLPKNYELTLTSDQVTAIQSAGKLYLNGCNIIVSKWTWTTTKTIYQERGNTTETIWTGSQSIDWNASPSTYQTISASAFTNAAAGKKLRINFSNMKLSAQGRIVKSNWSAFADANTYEKLPTAWGDYFEYTLTSDMVTELKANGMHLTGVGYTVTSVQLIDPMREYLVNASFDTADIKAWEPGDGTPHLSVTLTNNEEYTIDVPVKVSMMTDMFADYNNYAVQVRLTPGQTKTVDVEFDDLEAGFYRMAAKANNNSICTYYIGYNPTAIVSPNDAQDNFWQFWDTWKIRLAAIPMSVMKTLLEEQSTGSRNVYEVSMQSIYDTDPASPVTIWGYYAEPKAEGTYPCLIHFHGTDSGSGTPSVPGTDSNTGWCEYNFSARGQMLSRVKEGNAYTVDDKTDFYAYGLGDNDNHYYRMAYLDVVRAVDYVFSESKVNKDQVFAAGGSQGGCFTYVCAALNDGRIRAIAPSITGHADFVHTMEIVGWPTNVFNNWIDAQVEAGTYADYAAAKAALLRHQSYFDTKNFASRITCPVITNFSLQDNTDGPHLNISPYNLLTHVAVADKEYSINQFKGHASADNWSSTYMAFFQKYIDAGAKQKSYFLNGGSEGWATLCLDFKAEVPDGVEVYTATSKDDENGKMVLKRFESGSVMDANTAVVVKGTAQTDYQFVETDDDVTVTGDNLLKGVNERTAISTLNGGNGIMVLGKKSGTVGFYAAGTDYLPAHRAYLDKPSGVGARGYVFEFDEGGTPTGISTTLNDKGQMSNDKVVFDLQGRKVAQPARGLYVVNGKKVVIK